MINTKKSHLGFSINHITEPKSEISFDRKNEKLNRKYIIHGAHEFLLGANKNVRLLISSNFMSQRNFITLGGNSSITLKKIMLGIGLIANNYSGGNHIILGYNGNIIRIAYAYQNRTISSLGQPHQKIDHQISLRYLFNRI